MDGAKSDAIACVCQWSGRKPLSLSSGAEVPEVGIHGATRVKMACQCGGLDRPSGMDRQVQRLHGSDDFLQNQGFGRALTAAPHEGPVVLLHSYAGRLRGCHPVPSAAQKRTYWVHDLGMVDLSRKTRGRRYGRRIGLGEFELSPVSRTATPRVESVWSANERRPAAERVRPDQERHLPAAEACQACGAVPS